MNKIKIFIILITLTITSFAQVISISQLRNNTSNGVPVDSGKTFTISGVVTVANEFNSPSYMQDNTAGIAVYGRGAGQFSSKVKVGDSIKITAKLTHYNGLTQMDNVSSTILLDSMRTVNPQVITIANINGQAWNSYEDLEGELVRLKNVTIASSGNFSGNVNYNISDGTGTSQLRVVTGTNIVGQPIPTKPFDVIGVIGQFKTTSPYNSGYQIIPRFISDIITDNKPYIILPVLATNIDTSSFKVYFETIRPGNTEVRYGLTTSLELGSKIDTNSVTIHNIQISGLQPATRYFYKAFSTNENGTSEGPLLSANTSPKNPSTGTINVYFNSTVDNTVAAAGNLAEGNVDFSQKLIDRINSASYSIDMCVYSFYNVNNIVNALLAAKNRGVKVRIVYDSRTTQNSMQSLINAGFLISKRPTSVSGINHNKFFIFDGRDVSSTNDWVWTGSWNVSGDEAAWLNNVIEINDYLLAQAYTTEFEEMWGSNNDTPNSANAKFGSYKSNNTPHNFTIGGRDVQLYFSPSDGTNNYLKNTIRTADSAIYFAMFSYTRADNASEMIARRNAGAVLRGMIDQSTGSVLSTLQPYGEVFAFNLSVTLHHKYCLIDPSSVSSNPYVITGSHNWSNNANDDNDENTLIIRDISIANKYMQEFKRRYNDMGGAGSFIVPVISSAEKSSLDKLSFELYQNFPNPFNPLTKISMTNNNTQRIKLTVINALGEEVETIVNEVLVPGKYVFDFKGDKLSSGVYYSVLENGNSIIVKKMLMIK